MKNENFTNATMTKSRSMVTQSSTRTGLTIQEQTIAWMTSRLLSNKIKITGIENRCLMVSIKVSNMERYETFKLQVYKKLLKALTDMKVENGKDHISMLVAGDVEGSRKFNVDRSTMLNPYEPHYHMIIVFSTSLWDRLQDKLNRLMLCYANRLADLNETKFDCDDVEKGDHEKYFWWTIYDDHIRNKISKYKYRFPLGKLVSYSTKADLIANRLHLTNCQPSAFPHDLLLDENLINRSNYIFNVLASRQLGEAK